MNGFCGSIYIILLVFEYEVEPKNAINMKKWDDQIIFFQIFDIFESNLIKLGARNVRNEGRVIKGTSS
jgi:hypothetical protein